ncbi:BamA/TamA family outer membrane protein [Puniceicoccales bacterium CK1056]|uniref:BamA/TamA family outer membrane protein n=1 Tax=Oceanipulchritudo coccoides TaxID=2706888 RepID=A0A6B2M4U9_9BACT|nr:BamA/TamA family outer membrane protein [Oceanipulchritudo coccoides]NDV62875.1 BamA/TamA family outer membrane protein [Oceanipulchritudo coccoides]
MKRIRWIKWVLTGVLLSLPVAALAQSNVEVTGLGFLKNLEVDKRLAFLSGLEESERKELDLVEIEDLAYILIQLLRKEGFADPQVTGTVGLADDSEVELVWELPFTSKVEQLDLQVRPTFVRFKCRPGRLNYYESVRVTGVQAIDADTLQSFFIPKGVLFTRRKDRAFTMGNLDSRLGRLLSALRSKGFALARVVNKEVQVNELSGAVSVVIEVDEGPVHQVGKITLVVKGHDESMPSPRPAERTGAVLNTLLIREERQVFLNEFFHRGYPDATIRLEKQSGEVDDSGRIKVDLEFVLDPGPQVKLERLVFEPEGLLHHSVLKRQTRLKPGQDYDLLEVEEGRRRLLSLGVFKDVSVEHRELESGQRQAVYTFHPSPRKTLRMQLGYGSYELGRIGVRWDHLNLWGRAHRYEIHLKQSFKSTNFNGTYVVPSFFSSRVTAYARAEYEFREEISFDRTGSSLVFGISKKLQFPGAEISLEYGIEKQDTTRGSEDEFESLDQARVASLSLRAILDRRDSVLYPTEGFDLSSSIKIASDYLGGDTNFQKMEFSSSYHKYLGSSLYLHVGMRYGIIFSESPSSTSLPFTERFFPGGENSVRGYKRGEATSVTAQGDSIGSEAFALANIELEQRIFRNFSVVVFWDGIGLEETVGGFPDEEFLQSAGIGLRWRTAVGPVRLEYGHNLDPRRYDPDGSVHLSVGFPF